MAENPILDDIGFHKDDNLNRNFKFLHENWLPHARYKLSDETEAILNDDRLLYEYVQFTIYFTEKIKDDFDFRRRK